MIDAMGSADDISGTAKTVDLLDAIVSDACSQVACERDHSNDETTFVGKKRSRNETVATMSNGAAKNDVPSNIVKDTDYNDDNEDEIKIIAVYKPRQRNIGEAAAVVSATNNSSNRSLQHRLSISSHSASGNINTACVVHSGHDNGRSKGGLAPKPFLQTDDNQTAVTGQPQQQRVNSISIHSSNNAFDNQRNGPPVHQHHVEHHVSVSSHSHDTVLNNQRMPLTVEKYQTQNPYPHERRHECMRWDCNNSNDNYKHSTSGMNHTTDQGTRDDMMSSSSFFAAAEAATAPSPPPPNPSAYNDNNSHFNAVAAPRHQSNSSSHASNANRRDDGDDGNDLNIVGVLCAAAEKAISAVSTTSGRNSKYPRTSPSNMGRGAAYPEEHTHLSNRMGYSESHSRPSTSKHYPNATCGGNSNGYVPQYSRTTHWRPSTMPVASHGTRLSQYVRSSNTNGYNYNNSQHQPSSSSYQPRNFSLNNRHRHHGHFGTTADSRNQYSNNQTRCESSVNPTSVRGCGSAGAATTAACHLPTTPHHSFPSSTAYDKRVNTASPKVEPPDNLSSSFFAAAFGESAYDCQPPSMADSDRMEKSVTNDACQANQCCEQGKPEKGPDRRPSAKEVWSGEPDEIIEGGWPPGWTKKIFQRASGATKGHTDRYWYTPIKKSKLRSLVEVKLFLTSLEQCNGDEVEAKQLLNQAKAEAKGQRRMSAPSCRPEASALETEMAQNNPMPPDQTSPGVVTAEDLDAHYDVNILVCSKTGKLGFQVFNLENNDDACAAEQNKVYCAAFKEYDGTDKNMNWARNVGDVLVAIEGESTAGMSYIDVCNKLNEYCQKIDTDEDGDGFVLIQFACRRKPSSEDPKKGQMPPGVVAAEDLDEAFEVTVPVRTDQTIGLKIVNIENKDSCVCLNMKQAVYYTAFKRYDHDAVAAEKNFPWNVGDILVAIDGESTMGMPAKDVYNKIKEQCKNPKHTNEVGCGCILLRFASRRKHRSNLPDKDAEENHQIDKTSKVISPPVANKHPVKEECTS